MSVDFESQAYEMPLSDLLRRSVRIRVLGTGEYYTLVISTGDTYYSVDAGGKELHSALVGLAAELQAHIEAVGPRKAVAK